MSRTFALRGILGDEHRPRGPFARVPTLAPEPVSQSPTQTPATLHENDRAEVAGIAATNADDSSDMEIDELEPTPPPSATSNSFTPATYLAPTIKTEEQPTIRGVRRKFAATELPGPIDLNTEKQLAVKAFPELREKLSQLYQILDPTAAQLAINNYATLLDVPALSVRKWLAWRTNLHASGPLSAKRRRVTPTSSGRPAEISSTSATASHPSSTLGASGQGAVSEQSRPHAQELNRPGSLSISSNRQDTAVISVPGRSSDLPRSHAESARPLSGQGAIAEETAQSGLAPSRRESLVSPTASVTSAPALFPSPASSPATAHGRPLPPNDDAWRTPLARGPVPGPSGTWTASRHPTSSLQLAQPTGSPHPQYSTSTRNLPHGQLEAAANRGNGHHHHFSAAMPPGTMQLQHPSSGQHSPPNGTVQQRLVPSVGPSSGYPPNRQLLQNVTWREQQLLAQTVQGWQPPVSTHQAMQPPTQGLPVQQSALHQASHLSNQVTYTLDLRGRTLQQMHAQQPQQHQNTYPGQAVPPPRGAAPRASVPTQLRPGEVLVPESYHPGTVVPTPPPPPQFSTTLHGRPIAHHRHQPHGTGVPQHQGDAQTLDYSPQHGAHQPTSRRASGDYQLLQSGASVYGQQQQQLAVQQQLVLQQQRQLVLQQRHFEPANGQGSYEQQPPPANQPPPLGSSLQSNQYQWQQQPVPQAPTVQDSSAYPHAQGPGQQLQRRPGTHLSQQSPPLGPSATYNQQIQAAQIQAAQSNPSQQYDAAQQQQAFGNVMPDLRFAGTMAGGAQYPGNMSRGAHRPGNGAPHQVYGTRPPSAPTRPLSQPGEGQTASTTGWTPRHEWPSTVPQLQSQPYHGQGAQAPYATGYPQSQPRESPIQPSHNQYALPQQPPYPHAIPSQSGPPPGVPPALANAFDSSGSSPQVAQPPQQQTHVPNSLFQAVRPLLHQYDVPQTQPPPPAQRRQSHSSRDALPVERLAGPALAMQLAHAQAGNLPQPALASTSVEHVIEIAIPPASQPAVDRPIASTPPVAPPPPPPGASQSTQVTATVHVCWRIHKLEDPCSLRFTFRQLTDAEYDALSQEEHLQYVTYALRYMLAKQDYFTREGRAEDAQAALRCRTYEERRLRAWRLRAAAIAPAAQGAGQFSTTLPTPSPSHRFEDLPSPPQTAASPLPAPATEEAPAAAEPPALPELETMLYAFFDLAARGPLDASVALPALAALDNTTESAAAAWLMPYYNGWAKLRSPDSAMRANVQANMVQHLRRTGAYPQKRVKLQLCKPVQPGASTSTGDVEMSAGDVEVPPAAPMQKVEELEELEDEQGVAGTTTIGIATPDPTPEPLQRVEEPPPPPAAVATRATASWTAGLLAQIDAM